MLNLPSASLSGTSPTFSPDDVAGAVAGDEAPAVGAPRIRPLKFMNAAVAAAWAVPAEVVEFVPASWASLSKRFVDLALRAVSFV